jgi:hypothetical protein
MEKNILTTNFSRQNPFSRFYFSGKINKHKIVEIICLLFILLFIYTAISKIVGYQKFKVELGKSPLFVNISDYIAILIPTFEVAISLLLITDRHRLIGLYSSLALMVLFTAYIIVILNFTYFVPCSCGGVLQSLTWSQHIIFNSIFILFALIGIFLHSKKNLLNN